MKAADIHHIQKIYMIGIGGIGMSALARYFLRLGKPVAGYDRVSTPLTDELMREGAVIHFRPDLSMIREYCADRKNLLVIYTPAVPDDHPELDYFIKAGYRVVKRALVLGALTENEKCIAVAGTHGKTTISTLMAHVLKTAGIPCTAFLGGISKNYGSNLVYSSKQGWLITEADEFDRSFLKLVPDMAILTSCDPDHMDVYGSPEEMKNTYCRFIARIGEGGTLVYRIPLDLGCIGETQLAKITYSTEIAADYKAVRFEYREGQIYFDVEMPSGTLEKVRLGIPGRMNIENALAVISLSMKMGVDGTILKQALCSFRGVARRFDIQIQRGDLVYIDDYAHHPRELDACIETVKNMYPGRKVTGIFQPHLYSRTKYLAEDFARSLQALDELILLDIYPAREAPVKGVSSGIIFDRVQLKKKILIDKSKLMHVLSGKKPEVLLTLGAGDIDQFVEPIRRLYGIKQAS